MLPLTRRKKIEFFFSLPYPNSSWMVEVHRFGGGPADWSKRNDTVALPKKVVMPAVFARMEEANELPGLKILHFNTVGLAKIASRACPCKVFESRITAARPRHDMFNVEGGALECLVHATVFATLLGTLGDLALEFVRRGRHSGLRPSKWRASARTNDRV